MSRSPSPQPRRRDGKSAPPPTTITGALRKDVLALLTSKSVRETVESIVIAFALAFLFRTFEAEAFVIPTGSMAPTLQGRHQSVECPKCGYQYRISASQEIHHITEQHVADVAIGTCPNCRFTASTNVAIGAVTGQQVRGAGYPNQGAVAIGQTSKSRNGDRILVSKFAYEFGEPERWDVFVFRYPGQTARNYIKRLVGLPGETLKIQRGDIFTSKYDRNARHDDRHLNYRIARKSHAKARAMAQLVYDNEHQAIDLINSGWPARWSNWPRGAPAAPGNWTESEDRRSFTADGSAPGEAWIRYQHIVPTWQVWEEIGAGQLATTPTPQLIVDSYAYNTSGAYAYNRGNYFAGASFNDAMALGLQWVGDLVLEFEAKIENNQGELIAELVEGGRRFQCRIDVATGTASLSIDGSGDEFEDAEQTNGALPTAQTDLKGPGTFKIALGNVDDKLYVWIDGEPVEFNSSTAYRPLKNFIPKTDAEKGGDLAPAGIGSSGAKLQVGQLRLFRDIYYIASDSLNRSRGGRDSDYKDGPLRRGQLPNPSLDYDSGFMNEYVDFLSNPARWGAFADMERAIFPLAKAADPQHDQFMALGDNSPQSKDSRLWGMRGATPKDDVHFFVERKLLIGKALAIYWPLSHFGLVR